MPNSGQNRPFFVPCDLQIWWVILENNRAPHLTYLKLCASLHGYRSIQTRVTVRKHQIRVKISDFFVPCDLGIWQMTLKNNRAPLLCYFKLFTSFYSHRSIQAGVTVRKRQIGSKSAIFLSCVTLKFDTWPWKAIAHLFYATSSCEHDFIAICEFKLELQSGNGYVRFWPLWPWPLTSDHNLLHGHHLCQW